MYPAVNRCRCPAKIPLYQTAFATQSVCMEAHTWKDRTEDGVFVYRACHHAGKWTLECSPKVGRSLRDDVEWVPVEMTREHWETLRDILWRKYQRKRCPWEFIEKIDKLLEDMPGTHDGTGITAVEDDEY